MELEGVSSNLPQDHGGATHWGVTQAILTGYNPKLDIRSLTQDQAKLIYNKLYYSKVNLTNPTISHYHCFDVAVNSGQAAYKAMVNACKAPIDNGQLDPKKISSWRIGKYQAIVQSRPDQEIFLQGWLNRINRINKHFGFAPGVPFLL